MKIAFFGTGEFSKNILASIVDKIEVVLVVSQPDKKVGRKQEIEETPIKIFAKEKSIKVLQPEKLRKNEDFFEQLRDLNLDFIVVVAYGKIIPNEVLDAGKFGAINVHGSILPSYRGASPVQEALKNGDEKTGLTIMKMSEAMDEGDILQIKEIKVDIVDKTPDIFRKFEEIGADLLLNTLNGIVLGNIKGIPQNNDLATYCSKIEKENGKIDFKNEIAFDIYNKFRAYYIWPGIYSFYKGKKFDITNCFFIENYVGQSGQIIKLEDGNIGIVCKKGILILKKVKLEGKKEIGIKDFLNGNREFLEWKF